MALINVNELKADLEETVSSFADKLKQLRVGRPRAEMFSELTVTMYGAASTIQAVANVSIESATSVVIKPYFADKQLMEDIVKVVTDMNLGYNPVIDSDKIRVNIPAMTQERRTETIKEMGNILEDHHKSVRQKRHEYNEKVEKFEGVSEDEVKRTKNEIQKAVDEVTAKLNEMAAKKEEELNTL
jgi:ribosome recycling factor